MWWCFIEEVQEDHYVSGLSCVVLVGIHYRPHLEHVLSFEELVFWLAYHQQQQQQVPRHGSRLVG